jgi:hypothetical protein
LLDKTDGIAVFWPAAGVATGFLVAFGPTVESVNHLSFCGQS